MRKTALILTVIFFSIFMFFNCNKKTPTENEDTLKVTDIDGNTYQTVKIGDQIWMAENLKVTRYRNGDDIPIVTNYSEWGDLSTGAWCIYGNTSGSYYGLLYNWYAVNDVRNIAPEGWHVPSRAEWGTLIEYLGWDNVAGGKMKETGTSNWAAPNTGATNESGFTALPGGRRSPHGFYGDLSANAYFWSSSEDLSRDGNAWNRILNYDNSEVYDGSYHKKNGLSVRCVRD